MSINNNSYSTSTNIQFGSKEMDGLWWNATSFQLPSIALTPPKVNTRSGAPVNLASDTVDYEDLSIDLILDKQWVVYDELYKHFVKRLNVETGKFINYGQFDLWIQILDGEGNLVKKFWFYNCRLTNFGDVNFSTQDAEDEHTVLNMMFTFDYLDYDDNFRKEEKF